MGGRWGKGQVFIILWSFLVIELGRKKEERKGGREGGREGDSLSPSPCSEEPLYGARGFPLALLTREEVSSG